MNRPYYILFAGINGAGKSTLYRSGLWEHDHIADRYPRINSDEILTEHGWKWDDPKAQFRAGREAVELVRHYLAERKSFNQETTLSSRSIVKHIEDAHAAGYYISMHDVRDEHVSSAQARIAHRQSVGGHGIDPEVVTRRYAASVANLKRVLPICNEVFLYDNTIELDMIAQFDSGELAYCAPRNPAITWRDTIVR